MAAELESESRQLWRLLTLIGSFMISCGFVVFAFQCLHWLQNGEWQPVTIMAAWYAAGHLYDPLWTEWRGIAKATEWLMDQSLAATLMIFGCLIAWTGMLPDRLDRHGDRPVTTLLWRSKAKWLRNGLQKHVPLHNPVALLMARRFVAEWLRKRSAKPRTPSMT